MDRKHYLLMQKIIAVILTVVFLCQPILFSVGVLAEGEITPEPTPTVETQTTPEPTQAPQTAPEPTTEAQPTPTEEPTTLNNVTATPSPNVAVAEDTQTTEVTNNNQAEVNNDVTATANTGDNLVGTLAPTVTPDLSLENTNGSPVPAEVNPSPADESSGQATPTPEVLPTSEESVGGQQTNAESETATVTPPASPLIPPTPGPVAENVNTPDDSSSTALCISQAETTVINNNEAQVDNSLTATASSGENLAASEAPKIETGDTSVEANLANVVNLNLVGEDFWMEVFNLLGVNNGDLDFSSMDIQNQFNEAVATVMARNLATGDGSANIAAADFLKSMAVTNNNTASVTNILDLSAISGQNTAVGGDGEINTGEAIVTANLFNLINTNLIGNNFWFGVFNIFGEQNGDLILPYELQFLEESVGAEGTKTSAVNQNPGENSQNLANALDTDVITVANTNEAEITNKVEVLADTGTNTAAVEGSADISTGNVQVGVDIRNFVNTNIFGGRFVFLLINVFGKWQGALLNWWGESTNDGKTVLAVGQLPPAPQQEEDVTALNQNTGDNSQNLADASAMTSLAITNNNDAVLTNEIKGQAISGQNEVYGESGKIETGNSSVAVNIANFVNTNIVGNNFFFGIINIFGNFCGDILFPRPDLEVVKTANKATAAPGEEITYKISFKNSGRLWGKDVEIIDNLPAGVTFISASDGGSQEAGKVSWKMGKISSGGSGDLNLIVKVDNGVAGGTELINQVMISTSTDEPDKTDNQSSVKVTITIPGGNGGVGGNGGISEGVGGGSSVGQSLGSSCQAPKAPGVPVLVSATATSLNEVKLTWTAVEGASYYLVSYGTSSGNYLYGSPNVGNVTSYVVGSLLPGQTYYFAVAGVAGSEGCASAGPFSNELSTNSLMKVLGAREALAATEGQIGEGISTTMGEVAGASTPVCPWWWLVLAGEGLSLGGIYLWLSKKSKFGKFWWLTAPALTLIAFLGDKLAHHWWIPSQYCQYVPWGGLAIGGVESLAFKFLKRK